jgi:flagellar biosynthesis/type III secretory pathway chaperone
MKNKQTAVEWLYNNLKSHFEHDGDLLEAVQFSFNQAKEMEKEQINKACYDGYYQEEMMNTKEYYDKTFNSKIIQNKFGKLK